MTITEKDLTQKTIEIIQKDIINIPEESISDLYHSWTNKNAKPAKSVFNKKHISQNQFLPTDPYLLGIDFPIWFGDVAAKKRIMILGVDPFRNEFLFEEAIANKKKDVLIGTPYALHSTEMRAGSTRPYWEFIKALSKNNFVYLTDIYKSSFYTDSSKEEKSHTYYRKNKTQLDSIKKVLGQEIQLLQPDLIITLGKEGFFQLTAKKAKQLSRAIALNTTHLKSFPNIPIIPLVHLSGATKKQNILNFLKANHIDTSVLRERWEYGIEYSNIIENYLKQSV